MNQNMEMVLQAPRSFFFLLKLVLRCFPPFGGTILKGIVLSDAVSVISEPISRYRACSHSPV